MQASILPASRGPRWLIEGFAIFQRKPTSLSFLTLGYWLIMAVVSAIPLAGQLAGFLLIPVFSVSMMNACRLIDRKEELPPRLLFSGFHRNLQTLLALGLIYVLIILLLVGLSMSFDGGASPIPPVPEGAPAGEMSAQLPMSISPLVVFLLIPLNLIFHFAPILAAWHDMSAGKSLFFSLVACLRNWRPFLMFLLTLLAVAFVGVLAIFFIGGLFSGDDESARWLPTMTVVTMSLIFLPIWYASFYVGYRDIFVSLQDA
ncbi:MAG: hypothetical protein LBC91_06430, partial [Candidatus Accumulibacter sp.]|nr:hypothetical protein [Accumulibacter sp.]